MPRVGSHEGSYIVPYGAKSGGSIDLLSKTDVFFCRILWPWGIFVPKKYQKIKNSTHLRKLPALNNLSSCLTFPNLKWLCPRTKILRKLNFFIINSDKTSMAYNKKYYSNFFSTQVEGVYFTTKNINAPTL